MKKRLGEILIERQLISVEQLNTALAHQRQWSMRLGAALVAKGFITEGMLTRVLSEFLGIPMVDLSKVVIDQKAFDLVAVGICEQHDVFPISLKQQKGRRVLVLAMADPLNVSAIDEIAFRTGCAVQPAIAQLSSLDQAIRRFYHGQKTIVIAPLDFERTPLSRTGQPITNDKQPTMPKIEIPIDGGSSNWAALVQRPAIGGPGRDLSAVGLSSSAADRAAVGVGVALGAGNTHGGWLGADPEGEEGLPLLGGEVFSNESTGTFAVAPLRDSPPGAVRPVPHAIKALGEDVTESIEVRFWALMRVLSARGLVTKEEFLTELRWRE